MKNKEIFVAPSDFKSMTEGDLLQILNRGDSIVLNADRIARSRYPLQITTSLENAITYSDDVMAFLKERPELAIYIQGFKKQYSS